jgi:hypothetical protein
VHGPCVPFLRGRLPIRKGRESALSFSSTMHDTHPEGAEAPFLFDPGRARRPLHGCVLPLLGLDGVVPCVWTGRDDDVDPWAPLPSLEDYDASYGV